MNSAAASTLRRRARREHPAATEGGRLKIELRADLDLGRLRREVYMSEWNLLPLIIANLSASLTRWLERGWRTLIQFMMNGVG